MWQLTGQQQQNCCGEGKHTPESFAFKQKLKGDWIVLYFRKQSNRIWLLDSQKRLKVKCRNDSVQKQKRLSWELLKHPHDITATGCQYSGCWSGEPQGHKLGHKLELMKEYWDNYGCISKVSHRLKLVILGSNWMRHICWNMSILLPFSKTPRALHFVVWQWQVQAVPRLFFICVCCVFQQARYTGASKGTNRWKVNSNEAAQTD